MPTNYRTMTKIQRAALTTLSFIALASTIITGCAASSVRPMVEEEMVDPNCQIAVVAGGPIVNYFGVPGPNQLDDAHVTISRLEYADIWRAPPFRINGPANLVRLDIQGTGGGNQNWQNQINGVGDHSSISQAIVAHTVGNASTRARQAFVQRKVRNALVQSVNTGNAYRVTGFCN